MSLLLTVLLCLVVQLCMGDQPVEEVITTTKVHLLGDWSEKSPTAPDVQAATQYAVEMYNAQPRVKKVFKLVSIDAAKVKATNVINFEIEAVLKKTKCRKDENHDLKSCSLGKKEIRCHFVVTWDPRNDKHQLVHHKCKKTDNTV
ncbi:cystatin [Symphorus nematophorus]